MQFHGTHKPSNDGAPLQKALLKDGERVNNETKIDDFEKEIDLHLLGLRRLSDSGDSVMSASETFGLANKLVLICEKSGLPYHEIQKAIVYADNSLSRHLVPKDNDVL